MKSKFVIVTLVAMSTICSGVCARELSLSEVIKMAVEHSNSLKAAREQTNALEASHRAAMGERFPTLSATASAIWKSEIPSLDFAIPGGPAIQREFGSKETYQTDVKLSLPLFTGGKISGGIAAAKASVELTKASELRELQSTVYQARLGFLNLIRAGRLLEVSQSSLNRANITESDIQARFTSGTADSVDLNEARLTVANAELAVKRSQADHRTVELTLLVLVGMAAADHVEVSDSLPEPDTSVVVKSDVSDNKPEILSAAAKIEQSRSMLRIARSEFFPSLSAYTTYSYGKPNNDPFNSTWNDYFTVGGMLTWSFNLGQKTLYNSRSAKYFVQAFISQHDDVKEQLQRQADIAWENLKLAFEKYQIAVESFKLASNNYRLGREQHRQGVLSSKRLLENESALSEREAQMASALVDYHMMLITYYYDIGSDKLTEGTR